MLMARGLATILLVSLLLNGVLWALVFFLFPRDNPEAVLHYSVDVGIVFIGQGRQSFVLPLTGLLIIVGNAWLGWILYRTDKRSAWVFWGIIPLAQVILALAFFLIWYANE